MRNIKLFEEFNPFWRKNKDNDIAKGILNKLDIFRFEDLTFIESRNESYFLFSFDSFEIKSVMNAHKRVSEWGTPNIKYDFHLFVDNILIDCSEKISKSIYNYLKELYTKPQKQKEEDLENFTKKDIRIHLKK